MPRPDSPGAARQAAALAALRAAEAAARQGPELSAPAGPPDPSARDSHAMSAGAPRAPTVANGRVADDSEPDPRSVAHGIALRVLALRPHSRVELERKLARRGCDPQVAAEVLDRLTEVGLVDDAAYAHLLVQSRSRTNGLSGVALRRELREKGVDDDLAKDAVGALDDETERARAEELVAKKLRTMGGLDPQVQARRLAAMLARKGYPAGVAYAVVRDAVNAAVEHHHD
ncbi:MAG: regulatory protein RecX [Actinomycetales bacterium]|uniref:Regulatory protein RecX n=1 Tax=Candidatus Phosphoribacter hodrii TaxID=2953743 RepID=A0A9D7TAQ6_9MICO|nr:regulatory protein RecX [Candidatus Phosphoribacter hodrii]